MFLSVYDVITEDKVQRKSTFTAGLSDLIILPPVTSLCVSYIKKFISLSCFFISPLCIYIR